MDSTGSIIYPIGIMGYPAVVHLADDVVYLADDVVHLADDSAAGGEPMIAIVGGGASGTLAAACLLREARGRRLPLRVALIDRHGRYGLGQAYSTAHPAHLLNSPVSAMSALTGDPGHLARWAARAGLPHDGFLPRSTYGRYLTELLTAAERSARPRSPTGSGTPPPRSARPGRCRTA